ncbi:HK97 family phage prohead protease [Rummeliibacillus stabekisii]|uniref:HK97 family phage prohead protease n=1 Tax=Rummeliibacillus stabekisii TaxID=241244 RepID=UPI00370F89D0
MNKNKLEIRSMTTVEATEDMIVEGYALKFNSLSENFGNWREIILPEALTHTDLSDVRCLFDHDKSKVLGRTTANTLQINADDVGLHIRCQLPNTTYARDLYESIQRGDINQMSFGFYLADGGDKFTKDKESGGYIRTLTSIEKIYDVSIVAIPAYSDTNIAVAQRNLELVEDECKRQREILMLQLDLLKY